MKLREASGPILWCMRLYGFKGWASFWRTAYFLPGRLDDRRLVAHELKHLEQIERDGRALFTVKYLWWLCRYGYWLNPYEIEARAAERGPQQ